jgi:hypothetical protein
LLSTTIAPHNVHQQRLLPSFIGASYMRATEPNSQYLKPALNGGGSADFSASAQSSAIVNTRTRFDGGSPAPLPPP